MNPLTAPEPVGASVTADRTFLISQRASDQFAALSGDFNPLHLDPIAARRLLFGSTVLHGVHVLLKALDVTLAGRRTTMPLRMLRAAFAAPAVPDLPLTIAAVPQKGSLLRISVHQDGVPIQTITAEIDESGWPADQALIPDRPYEERHPRELRPADAFKHVGRVPLVVDRRLADQLFPVLSTLLPVPQLSTLLATTRIVGMECPGLHSILVDVALTFARFDGQAELQYRTVRLDKRMSLVRLSVSGGGSLGEITALFRPPQVAQKSVAELAGEVLAGEFAGQRPLIIGGSRGLGETVAKLLAIGGADVRITFARGRDDAARVTDEIRAHGGRCSSFPFDVLQPPDILSDEADAATWSPTHLYYFATPAIQMAKGRSWSNSRFLRYREYYVAGLERSLAVVDRLFSMSGAPLIAFVPSTVFIDQPLPGVGEYVAAKAESEVLCHALASQRPGLRIVCPRLPMLKTDQTSSLHAASAAKEPAPEMLAHLRALT